MHDLFPVEKYVEFDNEPWHMGRIVVHKVKDTFYVEVDVINKESHKIFRHVASLYNFDDHMDALEMGYRELRLKLGSKQDLI